jgi:NADP-dependent 3-hydroxy acid dehydrogenase YdfG
MMQLSGKTALITAAGSDTGMAVAQVLADNGMAVSLVSAQLESIESLAKRVLASGGQAKAICANINEEEGAKHAVAATLEVFGQIDLLVLISALWGGGLIHEHDVKTWDLVFAANLRGPFLVARAVLPGMRARHSGHVITLGSESGLGTYERDGAYGISLHALNALSAAIQVENEALGIRVDTLCTGLVLSAGTPDGLVPVDVAEWVVWLASRRENLKTNGPILVQTRFVGTE